MFTITCEVPIGVIQVPTSNADANAAQQKVEEQHQTINHLHQQLQSATQHVEELQAESSSVAQHRDALAALEGQHQTALSSLSAQHAELQRQHEALAKQSEKHKADWDGAVLSLDTAQHQNSVLSAQMAELQKQHAEAVSGLSSTKSEHDALSRKHAALQVILISTLCCCMRLGFVIVCSACLMSVLYCVSSQACSAAITQLCVNTQQTCQGAGIDYDS